MSNTLSVYGCGGAGINTISNNLEFLKSAGANIICIDSSDSNINTVDIATKYQIPGTVGSGGNQLENIETFGDSTSDILSHYPPSTYNIILASSSGGSGSVASIYLAKEIAKRGFVVVIIMLTTCDSLRRINNTINVIKSLESMSSEIKQPLVLMTHHQNADEPRKAGDAGINYNLKSMVYLFANRFNDLDIMDITNFFYYNKVSKIAPQLVTLTVEPITMELQERLDNSKPPIAAINIVNVKHRNEVVLNIQSSYSKTGYDTDFENNNLINSGTDIGSSYIIDNQAKHALLDKFSNLKVESESKNSASVSKQVNISNSNVIGNGFIFDE